MEAGFSPIQLKMIYQSIILWHLITILATSVLANHSQEHACKSEHETILVDLNQYTKKHCTVNHYTIHRHLFSDFSSFCSPVKENEKQ